MESICLCSCLLLSYGRRKCLTAWSGQLAALSILCLSLLCFQLPTPKVQSPFSPLHVNEYKSYLTYLLPLCFPLAPSLLLFSSQSSSVRYALILGVHSGAPAVFLTTTHESPGFHYFQPPCWVTHLKSYSNTSVIITFGLPKKKKKKLIISFLSLFPPSESTALLSAGFLPSSVIHSPQPLLIL